MKCPTCNTNLPVASGSQQARCLECGTLVALEGKPVPAQSAQSPAQHSYQTPFGKLIAQVQPKGGWGAAYEFAETGLPSDKLRTLVSNVLPSFAQLDSSLLAKVASFDEAKRRVVWKFGRGQDLVPLSSIPLPISPSSVQSLIEKLAGGLRQLHAAQLAVFDFNPATTFVDQQLRSAAVIPTLWLASEARCSPQGIASMPCVAPELAQTGGYPDFARADVYGLGALAWLLLTGESRKAMPTGLPSERSAALASWDPFIDGCCRTNPARRFASITDAVRALKSFEPIPASIIAAASPVAPSPTQSKSSQSPQRLALPKVTRRQAVVGIAATAAAAVWWKWSGGGGFAAYERGYADTIIRFADRSYEQAKWQIIKESGAIGEITRTDSSGDGSRCWGIAGWDDENFVVTREGGRVFQFHNGHWSLLAKVEDGDTRTPRMIDAETVLIASETPKHLFQISARGVRDFGEIGAYSNYSNLEIVPIAPDLIYCGTLKVASGKGDQISHDSKETFVHSSDNAPLKDYEVHNISHTASWKPGEAYGIATDQWNGYPRKVVRFSNGIWYVVEDLPKKYFSLRDAWFGASSANRFVVTVADDGYVLLSVIGGEQLDQSVRTAQENTSLKLIKVWGVSPEKYWVMDSHGTIWERNGTESRVVVRGLRQEGEFKDDFRVEFRDAWVSPTGTVIAITEKYVYRLS